MKIIEKTLPTVEDLADMIQPASSIVAGQLLEGTNVTIYRRGHERTVDATGYRTERRTTIDIVTADFSAVPYSRPQTFTNPIFMSVTVVQFITGGRIAGEGQVYAQQYIISAVMTDDELMDVVHLIQKGIIPEYGGFQEL